MHHALSTPTFARGLQRLARANKQGKDAAIRARAAMQQAANEGKISVVKRTKHGESRLPDIEKYDLGDGHRLVVQLVDGETKTRAFLFVGTHDDAEQWLQEHRNSKWVRGEKDQTLRLINVTDSEAVRSSIIPKLEIDEDVEHLSVLRHLNEDDWRQMGLTPAAKAIASSVTQMQWSTEPDDVLAKLAAIGADSGLMQDIFLHAEANELDEVRKRLELHAGSARALEGEELANAMLQSADEFVDYGDLALIPDTLEWADWMVFLHPSQKELVTRDLNGPARLRGVSGSGKTCIMVHRARFLAKKYKDDSIVLITLTESMRRLLDEMVDALCGVEGSRIVSYTVNKIAEQIINALHPAGRSYRVLKDERFRVYWESFVQGHIPAQILENSHFSKMGERTSDFMLDETNYIRSRVLPSEYERYLDPKKFSRRGRGAPLRVPERAICLGVVREWEKRLERENYLDHVGIVQLALSLLSPDIVTLNLLGWSTEAISQLVSDLARIDESAIFGRSILVDEVQDLSQLEVDLIGAIPVGRSERAAAAANGLFLVGDGAQSVYKKGFSLREAKIDIRNRSFVLARNYRNTNEIIAAAYTLVESYEFADEDEDSIARPTAPKFPSRHGPRPQIIGAKEYIEQFRFVCHEIVRLRQKSEEMSRPAPTICIIGMRPGDRTAAFEALRDADISALELKQNTDFSSVAVKISTIESAKGHEFEVVFVVNLIEGVLPRPENDDPEGLTREAARLYVAMTRAKERLYLVYTEWPSRFLGTISEKCDDFILADGHIQQRAPTRGKKTKLWDSEPPTIVSSDSPVRPIPAIAAEMSGVNLRPIFFDRYVVEQEIDGAGMSDVFRVRSLASGEILFMKMVRLTKVHNLDALQHESSLYQKIHMHGDVEGVVKVIGVERDEERCALVLEYADGGDLSDYVPRDGLPAKEVLEIAHQILLGLHSLQVLGIVHRDLKPANVVRVNGVWKIADFGIAKDVGRVVTRRTFQSHGTRGYAPPEQLDGVTAHPSADVYAFGKVVVFLATGQTDVDHLSNPRLVEIVTRCTDRNISIRPTVDELTEFFESL